MYESGGNRSERHGNLAIGIALFLVVFYFGHVILNAVTGYGPRDPSFYDVVTDERPPTRDQCVNAAGTLHAFILETHTRAHQSLTQDTEATDLIDSAYQTCDGGL